MAFLGSIIAYGEVGVNRTRPLHRTDAKLDTVQINQERSRLRVILNEVKDHGPAGNVYVNRYCRRVILHFVQDDM
jgi:hypothetical protein